MTITRRLIAAPASVLALLAVAGVAMYAAHARDVDPFVEPKKQPAPPPGAPLVEITKTCPNIRYLGRDATFEITVTNRGTAPAANVTVTDTIPNGVEFLNADNGGRRDGGRIVWSIGTLPVNQPKLLKMTVRCNTITTVRNVATVTYCVESSASCEFPVRGIPAILLECVDDPDPVEIGGQLTYTIMVTNQGSSNGTNILVECTLPPEEEFVNAAGATAARNEGRMVRFAPLATLAPKARATFTVTVRAAKPGDVRFGVSLKSDQLDSPVTETESTHLYD